jgi:DNA (cytosine-5)-methyltransferase 1
VTLILNEGEIHRDWIRTPSGLILAEDSARLRYAPKKHPQGGDIFSGCGGASLGAKMAGIHVRFAVEYWTTAAVTYMVNLGSYPCTLHFETDKLRAAFEKEIVHTNEKTGLTTVRRSGSSGVMDSLSVPGTDHMWVWDAAKLTGAMLLDPLGMRPGELDVLHGSPPCQGFSTAGKQDPHDPRNLLMLEYARLITEIRPKCFTMEQVPNALNMTTADGQPMIEAFTACLEEGGYASRKAIAKMIEMQGGGKIALRPTEKGMKSAGKSRLKSETSPIASTLSRIRAASGSTATYDPREARAA